MKRKSCWDFIYFKPHFFTHDAKNMPHNKDKCENNSQCTLRLYAIVFICLSVVSINRMASMQCILNNQR